MKTVPVSGVALRLHTLLFMFLLCVLLLSTGGCFGSGLDEEFVRAVDKNWDVIGPDYRQYLESDGSLSDRSKRIRLRAVAEFSKLVDDAKAEFEKEGGSP